MDKYYILTFQNTHGAISAENTLKERNIKIEIMPTPTAITKSCGISIKINEDIYEKVGELINNKMLTIKNVYVKEGQSYKAIEL